MIEKIVNLLKESESLSIDQKKNIIDGLEYMPEWQLKKTFDALLSLREDELKFKSDIARIDMKYRMISKKEIEKLNSEE